MLVYHEANRILIWQSPNILDPPSLRDFYKDVKVNASTYFENAAAFSTFEVVREWSALGKPVDRDQWYVPYLLNVL